LRMTSPPTARGQLDPAAGSTAPVVAADDLAGDVLDVRSVRNGHKLTCLCTTKQVTFLP
jgi:hypothetical protein